jgi:hypothetical protein
MIAIEFETQTHNGMVEIPKQYRHGKIKLSVDAVETKTPQTEISFKAIALNTKGYHFDR